MDAWMQTVGHFSHLIWARGPESKHGAMFTSVMNKMVESLIDISWDGLHSSLEMMRANTHGATSHFLYGQDGRMHGRNG